jgi:hypothetical protein
MTTGRTTPPGGATTRRPLAPEVRRAAVRAVIAANTANGKETDARIVAIAEGKTKTQPSATTKHRPRAPEVRRAAARMVIVATEANGETPDPRIIAVAEGKPVPDTRHATDS